MTQQQAQPQPPKKPKILIVDDEADTRALMKAILSTMPTPCEVIEAYGGRHGIQAVLDEKPDLVLLDIVMPDLDGIGVLMELKKYPAARNIKIVLVSARQEERMVQSGMAMGAIEYITKPFTQEQIHRLVARVLSL